MSRSFFGWAQLARERAPARAAARARALEPQLRSGTQRPRPRARSGEPPLQRRSRPRRFRGTRGTPLKNHPQLRIAEGNDAHRARGTLRRERVGRQPPTKKGKDKREREPPPSNNTPLTAQETSSVCLPCCLCCLCCPCLQKSKKGNSLTSKPKAF